ncbi:aspartate-semialdehyde dehydrogenase [Roseobacter sp. MED193]|nr:aspartate-semialdehyde dehydrogenase [Roseobacter sp. MED193]
MMAAAPADQNGARMAPFLFSASGWQSFGKFVPDRGARATVAFICVGRLYYQGN